MYLIVSGEVAVVASGRDGDEIEVARIGQGNWLGEAVMIARAPYPSTARACADVEALAFPREALDGPMSSDPGTARFLLGLLAAKCVGLNKRIEELTVMPARERLARHIVGLYPGGIAERAPGVPCQVRLPRKKREMAALLGIAPETLSRVMRSLEEDGIIEVKASRILIRDCPRLLAEAGL
jgi:CRP/FNR family transcriptional regulator